MILTSENRYGVVQALTLHVWPWLSKLMIGGTSKYRGIKIETLGAAIAHNSFTAKEGEQRFQWKEIARLGSVNTG